MKKREVIKIYDHLKKCESLGGKCDNIVKFKYAVAKNITLLEGEYNSLKTATNPTNAYLEFDKKRVELCMKHANKDENDKLKVINGEYDVKDETGGYKKEFIEDYTSLSNECKAVIEDRNTQMAKYETILDTENFEVELYKIKLENIPDDIEETTLKGLLSIIEE